MAQMTANFPIITLVGLDKLWWAGAGKRRAALVENPRHPPFA